MDRGTYSIWSLSASDPPRPRIVPFLAIGKGNLLTGASDTHIVTLVERHSRFTMLVKLPRKDTTTVVATVAKHIRKLPEQLRRSLTWDQGKEICRHKRFTVATNVQVFALMAAVHGSVAATRTPTACCDSTSREEPISRASPRPTSMALLLRLNQRPRKTLALENTANRLQLVLH